VNATPQESFLRIADVLDVTGFRSRERIRQLENEARFPRRIRINGGEHGAVGWLKSEVDQWVHDRIAASRSAKAAA